MIDNLIRFSIKNKLIIGMFVLALIIWGGYSFTQLPIDAVPDITNNQVQVITQAPSLAPQEVEKFISAPVELALVNVPRVVEMRSISNFGLSVVTVVFEEDADIYTIRQLVAENLKKVDGQIPAGYGKPELMPITTGLGEIYQYIIRPQKGFEKKYSTTELRTIQDWIIKRQISGTPGVVEVSSFGGFQKQYEVSIDPEKLRAMNLSMTDIFKTVSENNANTGGSYIEKRQSAYFIRGEGLAKSIEDIENMVVANRNNIPVLVKDVAKVQFGHAVRYGAMTEDGEGEVVGGIVMMLKGANSAEVIGEVKKKVDRINQTLPEGLKIEAFLDRTKLVNTAIKTVTRNLVEGGLIVIFVLVLLLGNLRAGLVVASVIPLSLLFAISMMNVFGVSANLMSLGAIDFGLIVDGAVIIVESVIFHITSKFSEKNLKIEGLNQSEMDDEVFESASKIRNSAAFGEVIILMVYIPILALVGVEGKMFRPMAETVIFAIFGALILSMTYVPMASALFLSKKISHKKTIADRIIDFFHKGYDPLIRKSLKNKILIVAISLILLICSILVFMQLGGEFIPTLDEGDFAVDTRVVSGSSLSHSVETTLQAQKILKKQFPDEVIKIVSKIGNSEVPTDPMTVEASDMMVILKDRDEWKKAETRDELAEKMSEALSVIPGVSFDFQQPIQMRFNELMTGVKSDIAIKIYGEDLDILFQKANSVARIAKKIEGVGDVKVEQITGLQQVFVEYNRSKLAQYGVNVSELNQVVRTAFAGEIAGVIFEGEKRFDLVVRLDSSYRIDIQNVKNLFVNLPNGNQVSLDELATISYKEAPMQISRDNAKRRITIGINARGRDVESIVKELQAKITQVKLPAGYYYTYGGQFENLQAAKQRLSVAVPIALLLIFVLLYFTFHSIKESLLIFTAIPLSAIGGIMALWVRDMPFSVSAGVGFIALFGVAVLNGIVLMGQFNILEKEGIIDVNERILKGTQIRFRPVLMTALVASLGFLPMAISNSSGAEVQKPLATVVIGGLISATLLTLIVLPVLYSLFADKKKTNHNSEIEPESSKIKESNVISDLKTLKKVEFREVSFFDFLKLKSVVFYSKYLIFLILFFPLFSPAQSNNPLTLQQAIDLAVKQNQSLKIADYETRQQQILKKTAFDINKTSVDLQYGQIQQSPIDYTLSIQQSSAFPTFYSAQKTLANSTISSYEQRFSVQKNDLVKQVKSNYYQLLNLYDQLDLINRQDTLYQNSAKASEVRYRTGETNQLENISAQARSRQIANRKNSIISDIKSQQRNLQRLMNTSENTSIVYEYRQKRKASFLQDSSLLAKNPILNYLRSQVEVSGKVVSVEKNRLMPDLRIGYFNQSIEKVKNFQGIYAGVSVPLFFGWYKARIQAAEVGKKISEENLLYQEKQLQSDFEIIGNQLQKLTASISYYEEYALPQAQSILTTAEKSFRLGEIDYTAYILNTSQAWQIQEAYFNDLLTYNLLVINIESLIGQ